MRQETPSSCFTLPPGILRGKSYLNIIFWIRLPPKDPVRVKQDIEVSYLIRLQQFVFFCSGFSIEYSFRGYVKPLIIELTLDLNVFKVIIYWLPCDHRSNIFCSHFCELPRKKKIFFAIFRAKICFIAIKRGWCFISTRLNFTNFAHNFQLSDPLLSIVLHRALLYALHCLR